MHETKLCAGKTASKFGQIQNAINKCYPSQRVNRNEMPYGAVAWLISRIWQNSKQTPSDWWDPFGTFANKSVRTISIRHTLNPICMRQVSASAVSVNHQDHDTDRLRKICTRNRSNYSIYCLICTLCCTSITFNQMMQMKSAGSHWAKRGSWMNLPHNASITVNNEAAGNRTDTLNSSICSKSTEKKKKLEWILQNYFSKCLGIRELS